LAGIRCFAPANFIMYVSTSLLGSFVQIPLMCLYGVLLAMAVDYNEWKYDKKLVAMSGGAIGFGNKVGSGLGSLLLSLFLILGSYDASLAVASPSMRMSIFGFSNYLPLVINILMFFLFRGFDLEEKLPQLRKEIENRRANKSEE
jgi:GPH family glycoside/pentoside/hexuronide:cation symporter